MLSSRFEAQAPSAKLLKSLLDSSADFIHQKRTCYGYSQLGKALVMLTQITDPNLPTLMIVAGTHGDEVAGVEAAHKFWTNEAHKYLDQVNLVYYPCVNPDGFNAGTRLTAKGQDINREFYFETNVPEARQLILSMNRWGKSIDFLLHLHEDNPTSPMDLGESDDPIGSYLYLHGVPNHTYPIAGRIIDNWQSSGHLVHHAKRLYGAEINAGVIHCTEDNQNLHLREAALLDRFVTNGEHCMSITVETLTTDDLKERVAMQYDAIETTIKILIKRPRLDQCTMFN